MLFYCRNQDSLKRKKWQFNKAKLNTVFSNFNHKLQKVLKQARNPGLPSNGIQEHYMDRPVSQSVSK